MARIVQGYEFPDDASDEEIAQALGSVVPGPPVADTTSVPRETSGPNLLGPAVVGGTGVAAGVGGGLLASKLMQPKVTGPPGTGGGGMRAAGKFLARRIPGVGDVLDAADLIKELRGTPPGTPPMAEAPIPMRSPPGVKLPASITTVSQAEIDRFPQLKGFSPGDEISRKALEKIKLETPPPNGMRKVREHLRRAPQPKTPTRPIKIVEGGKTILPESRAPVPTKEPPYSGGRGASRPELARRAAQLRGEPIPGTVASRAAETGPRLGAVGEALDPQLARAAALRSGALRGLGGAGNALGMYMMIVDAKQQADALHQQQLEDFYKQYPNTRLTTPQGI